MQRKSCLQFALVAAVLGMAEGFARTVSVVSHDAATAHVALALSEESTGGGIRRCWPPGRPETSWTRPRTRTTWRSWTW